MDKALLIELFGYLGSLLVVVSMLMTSVMRLRVINTIGSIIFAIYALIIRSYPTALMNFFLVGINIYQMIRLSTATGNEYFFTEVGTDDRYLNYLLDYYRDDISRYFPQFAEKRKEADRAYIVSLDAEPVGITMGQKKNGSLDLFLDYSVPAYRDCSVGEFLYPKLKSLGYTSLTFEDPDKNHTDYMGKVGFVKDGDSYRKTL